MPVGARVLSAELSLAGAGRIPDWEAALLLHSSLATLVRLNIPASWAASLTRSWTVRWARHCTDCRLWAEVALQFGPIRLDLIVRALDSLLAGQNETRVGPAALADIRMVGNIVVEPRSVYRVFLEVDSVEQELLEEPELITQG